MEVTSALQFDSLVIVMPSELGGEFGSVEDSEEMGTQQQVRAHTIIHTHAHAHNLLVHVHRGIMKAPRVAGHIF